MTVALTYDEVKALNPTCGRFTRIVKKLGGKDAWNGNRIDAATARAAGASLDDLIWVTSALVEADKNVERRLRLWVVDCAAHVLHIYEKTEASTAPRKAIIASRQYARGEIDGAAWDTARGAAWDTARATAGATARAAAWAAAWGMAWGVAWAARDAAGAEEEQWQFDRFIAWFSDNEPDDWPLPPKQEAA